jgi:nicotinamide phosphoribosyltransferase
MPSTSATIAMRVRTLLDTWAEKVGAPMQGVAFQGHDFSMRGMSGLEASCVSALGHLVAFTGTETVPVLNFIDEYYPTDEFLAGTVPATEHSVMCAGGETSELETFRRLFGLYPNGILSVVSDTWDLWNVLTNILPALHDEVMARDGKLVIRPDSGDPADIICGTFPDYDAGDRDLTPEDKGVYELLWDEFGGTINEKGYKVLDSHVGVIYGDAMNFDRIKDICERLISKGFAPTVVFGLGSYGYQYQTRDTFGFAMKATNVVIEGEERAIFKDPKTDSGTKKSLKGRIGVYPITNYSGEVETIVAVDELTPETNVKTRNQFIRNTNLLTTVWKDGKFVVKVGLDEVRANARK